MGEAPYSVLTYAFPSLSRATSSDPDERKDFIPRSPKCIKLKLLLNKISFALIPGPPHTCTFPVSEIATTDASQAIPDIFL